MYCTVLVLALLQNIMKTQNIKKKMDQIRI